MSTETLNGHKILLPDAETFGDVFEYLGEWDYDRDHGSNHERRAPIARIGNNEISDFCWMDLSQVGGPKHRSIKVKPSRAILDAVRPRIVTPDDHLSFRVIAHKTSGRALVILEHGYIIGSHWLAYIDPATIPDA